MAAVTPFEQQLRAAGFQKGEAGFFVAANNPRVVALTQASTNPASWRESVDEVLRHESFRVAPTWSRYIVLVLDAQRTPELAAAAAAFSRDVSKCRRIVVFRSQASTDALPFLPLPQVPGGTGTPGHNLEEVVHRELGVTQLATIFLDDQSATTHVQNLAEESED